MAIYKVDNGVISIQVKSKGAELCSLTENATGQEYMWSGSPDYWPRVSPVLFPFIGWLKDKKYVYQGKEYSLSSHGFARDMEFELWEQTDTSLWMSLTDTEETRAKYPFAFQLLLGYELNGRTVQVKWKVMNKNNGKMYFSIGGHPGFACPLHEGEKRTDYYVAFDTPDKVVCNGVDMDTGLATDVFKEYPLKQGMLAITEDLFDHDALVIEGHQAGRVSLLTPDKKPYITVSMDAPLFGVWSCVKHDSPFVCIEPWYGRCDSMNFEGTLEDRKWQQCIDAGETFEAGYEILVHER